MRLAQAWQVMPCILKLMRSVAIVCSPNQVFVMRIYFVDAIKYK